MESISTEADLDKLNKKEHEKIKPDAETSSQSRPGRGGSGFEGAPREEAYKKALNVELQNIGLLTVLYSRKKMEHILSGLSRRKKLTAID
ncbi:MAG: hypothetical protein FWH52_05290 [Synergistaceae bacterium]|nr:hypothetical protein [Synergistaceae bacterium]